MFADESEGAAFHALSRVSTTHACGLVHTYTVQYYYHYLRRSLSISEMLYNNRVFYYLVAHEFFLPRLRRRARVAAAPAPLCLRPPVPAPPLPHPAFFPTPVSFFFPNSSAATKFSLCHFIKKIVTCDL